MISIFAVTPMEEVFADYIGAQVQVRDTAKELTFRGEVAELEVDRSGQYDNVVAKLNWMAELQEDGQWVAVDKTEWRWSLGSFILVDAIGLGFSIERARAARDQAMFYLPGERDKGFLDREKVRGL